ncbi:MAG: helix-turn-helix transcriptional regulator [Phycisphaerales bacterium]
MPLSEAERNLAVQRGLMEEVSIGIEDLMGEEISRADLAARLGRSRGFVTKILSGSHNFTLATLADVFRVLGRRSHLRLSADLETTRAPVDEEAAAAAAEAEAERTRMQIMPAIRGQGLTVNTTVTLNLVGGSGITFGGQSPQSPQRTSTKTTFPYHPPNGGYDAARSM